MSALLLPGLDGEARIVRTRVFTTIADRLAFTIAHHGTLVVAGHHGTGKRLATLTCLAEQPLPHVVVPLTPAPTDHQIVRLLHQAIHHDRDGSDLAAMQDDLADTLAEQPRIVVIDHADELTVKAAGQLQYLHARPGAAWTLLLLGGPGTSRAVAASARLTGDVLATVEVHPLTGDELITAVRGMHQLFAMADQPLLQLIDRDLCHGLLKQWARFLQIALSLRERAVHAGKQAPVLDVTLARAVTTLMPQVARKTKP